VSAGDRDTAAVVVNYRTKELTVRAVESVLSEDDVREVVVVDNASGDGSAEFLRAALLDERVRVIDAGRNGGFGAGVNLGAAACRSPLLFVLNSDATVTPGSLTRLVSALLADAGAGVLAPAVVLAEGTTQPDAFGRLPRRWELLAPGRARWTGGGAGERHPGWVSGVAMLLRAADFRSVGGFDERFEMYFEDVDLCRRLRASGRSVERLPSATVVHAAGASWPSRRDQKRRYHRSKALYAERLGASRLERRVIAVIGRLRARALR
jgi:N-acetylglucosaminyl-diphospho-decaprenol L-rhamnosyltransferase